MTENQKDSVKKSFWQRNLFLLIIISLVIVAGGVYLYQNKILTLSLSSQGTPNSEKKDFVLEDESISLDTNSLALQEKVDRLETLILELAQDVQNIPEPQIIQPEQEPTPVILSNEDAYELIITINQIIINIDQQQIRNKHVQKLQNQYLFFQDSKFEELLTLPDYSYLLQELDKSEISYVQKEFMKNNNFQWIKKIISNIFDIHVAKASSNPLASFINSILNRQYANALVEFEKLNADQKIYFQSTYHLAKIYNTNQIFLENMI
ncbi:hypothetical protein N9Y54_01475 [Alphaproteobacteria bacterium]|nr:hypothetical protein [Alphaproteobacteria bacterium]